MTAKTSATPIAGNGAGVLADTGARPGRRFWQRVRSPISASLASLLLVGMATTLLLSFAKVLPLSLVPLVFLIPVVVAATRWGLWPAALASLTGAAAASFFFYPPYYSLRIDDPQQIADILLFLFVAFVASNLAGRVRREADALRQRERYMQGLYEFSRQLALCFTIRDLVVAAHNYVSTTLGRRAAFIARSDNSDVDSLDEALVPPSVRHKAAAMIAANDRLTTRSLDPSTQVQWLLKAVSSEAIVHGIIAVELGNDTDGSAEDSVQQIDAFIAEAALTLERIDVGKALNEARLRLQADMLRDAMHGLISHELRTPLTSVIGLSSVLMTTAAVRGDDTAASLVDGIMDEASRLDAFLKNLIDASRVTQVGVGTRLDWVDPADIINAAIARRSRQLQRHRVQCDIDDHCPLIKADSVLVEEACGQLLDNAAKYSPVGSLISVAVFPADGHLIFSVTDEGFGLTTEEQQHMGQKSFRGKRHTGSTEGFGLGLWIALAFVKVNGGTLEIRNRSPRAGTIATISLPTLNPAAQDIATAS